MLRPRSKCRAPLALQARRASRARRAPLVQRASKVRLECAVQRALAALSAHRGPRGRVESPAIKAHRAFRGTEDAMGLAVRRANQVHRVSVVPLGHPARLDRRVT